MCDRFHFGFGQAKLILIISGWSKEVSKDTPLAQHSPKAIHDLMISHDIGTAWQSRNNISKSYKDHSGILFKSLESLEGFKPQEWDRYTEIIFTSVQLQDDGREVGPVQITSGP